MHRRRLRERLAWSMMYAVLAMASSRGVRAADANAKPPISWHIHGEVVVPFEYFRQHIYVPVSLNGRPGFVFLLDSGANRNVLNLSTSDKLGRRPQHLIQEKQVGFGNGLVYAAPEEDMTVTLCTVPIAEKVSVLDLNAFQQHFAHVTDGILGYPFLRHYVVRVDFGQKLVTMEPSEHFRYRGFGVVVPVLPGRDFPVIPVRVVAGRNTQDAVNALVDSGSNMAFVLYRNAVARLHLEASLQHAVPAQGFGLNGYYPMSIGNLDALEIGLAEAHHLPITYLENEQQLESARNIPAAIGNEILESFQAVIFDVPHGRMIFELKSPPWQPGRERTATAPH